MEAPKEGPCYIVAEDREDPFIRYITAEFISFLEAQQHAEDAGGDLVTRRADIAELVELWERGDYSRQAHVEASQELAEFFLTLENQAKKHYEVWLFERYAETDPVCAAVLRVRELLEEASRLIDSIIPPDATHFQGVGIRSEWKPSEEAMEALAEVQRKEALEVAEAS